MLHQANRFANLLRRHDVQRGGVATLLGRCPELFVAVLGTLKGGHVYSPMFSAFGPEPILTQSAYFRYHNRSSIPGLYFVGAGTHPGAGVPGVLSSAKVLDRFLPHV